MYVTLLKTLTYAGADFGPGEIVNIEDKDSAAWLISIGVAEETGGVALIN
ncbi:MAG: hypothetical protein M3436_01545 [Pseudomonadota bacterium]|nr:hypothetical protein [Pseudomonadota bacterium]